MQLARILHERPWRCKIKVVLSIFRTVRFVFSLDGDKMMFHAGFFVIFQHMGGFWTHSSLGVIVGGRTQELSCVETGCRQAE